MINALKSSNVALGYDRQNKGATQARDQQMSGMAVNKEIGETSKMYSYVQRRGFASNVLPLNSNAAQMKPTNAHVSSEKSSINRTTFRWNNINVT